MASRANQQILLGLVNRVRRAMVVAGMISNVTSIALERGSSTYKNAYRLWIVSPAGRESLPFSHLHFGFTSTECARTLETLAIALEGANESWIKKTRSALMESPTSTGGTTFRQEYPPATSAG